MRMTAWIMVLIGVMQAISVSGQDDHPEPDERGFFVSVGDPIPEFELTDVQGHKYSNKSLLGQSYVLQFTASWCGVCRKEMPHLEKEVWQGGKGHLVIGVDLDESKDRVVEFAEQTGVTYPMAPDADGAVFKTIAAPKSGVTRNVVVDAQGHIVFLTRLFDEEEFDQMKAVLVTLNP